MPTASAKLEKSGDQEMPLIAGHRIATRQTPASDVGQATRTCTDGIMGTLTRNELYCRRRRPSTHIINPPFSLSLPRPSPAARDMHTYVVSGGSEPRARPGFGRNPVIEKACRPPRTAPCAAEPPTEVGRGTRCRPRNPSQKCDVMRATPHCAVARLHGRKATRFLGIGLAVLCGR